MFVLFLSAAVLCAYVAFACAHGAVNPFNALWKRAAKLSLAVLHSALLWLDLKALGGLIPSFFIGGMIAFLSVTPAIGGFAFALVLRKRGTMRTMDRRQLELSPN